MKILGINETTHDASVTLIEDGNILFAGHAERFSKEKNDWYTNDELIDYALSYGEPDRIAYYEHRWLKKARIITRGGFGGGKPYYLNIADLKWVPRESFSHHYSHAAAGYYTSKFDDAAIVVLDAIGEFNTTSIWVGEGSNIKSVEKKNYPFSFGLFYSAFTNLVGLKPNEEEYIFMGMAAYGDWRKYYKYIESYFDNKDRQAYNFHRGIHDWPIPITEQDRFDIAAAVQHVYTVRLYEFMMHVKRITGKKNLVFMGGCALYGKHVNWQHPYLGYDLGGPYPVTDIITGLIRDKVVAVASGRAEYGPRALGNRSILADPRDPDIKDKVNLIKKRELFRPFAPVVMEEHAHKWFKMDFTSPYMQYAVECLQPDKIPAVVHKDGTSRVQTVNKEQHPGLYEVLSNWYAMTGVPVLLNTSLNIKGQPLLNDENDIVEWEKTYNTKIAGRK